MLEEKIVELIEAISGLIVTLNKAIVAPEDQGKVEKQAKTEKPTTGKKGGKGKGGRKKSVTVEEVKQMAKKLAQASDDPKDCILQIKGIVTETSALYYDGDDSKTLDEFEEAPLILLKEALEKFEYTPEPPAEPEEDLEI